MSLRPQAARWFELLVVRDDLGAALDVLARSSRVELQSHGEAAAPIVTGELQVLLEEYDELDRRFEPFWPTPQAHEPDERAEPHAMLEDAMARLRSWVEEARDTVEQLETSRRQEDELSMLGSLLEDAGRIMPDLGALAGTGPMLDVCLYQLATDDWPESLPGAVITQRLTSGDCVYLLGVGLRQDIDELGRQLRIQRARNIQLPDGLPAKPAEAAAWLEERVLETAALIDALEHRLRELNERHDLADAIADVRFVRWYVDNVPDLASTENFAWITGWSSELDEESLLTLLADENIKGLLHITEPPPGLEPPLILVNPGWMRQFEVFTRMLGVPTAGEADPTRIVAIVSPLMFGYMFSDVGQGAVLMIIGAALSRRYPATRLLVAGGAMSIFFGFVFGSVFALENVITPLWLHPMEDPLRVFAVPLIGGAVLLLVGMFLDALQAYWQQRARAWWQSGAGLVLCYIALLGSIFDSRMLLVSLLGASWFVVGHGLGAPAHRISAAGTALIELLESLLQLLVNTISFVRVGAFALAHAGLSVAVTGIADVAASVPGKIVVLVIGNVVIIALEGLVAGIQTTRLVLFEFFVRFLKAEGRPFVPLAPANGSLSGQGRKPS